MASQMLASVKGMSACTTRNGASASTTESSCGVSQQTRTCARTPIGRYLRVGVRHRDREALARGGVALLAGKTILGILRTGRLSEAEVAQDSACSRAVCEAAHMVLLEPGILASYP